MAFQTDNKGGPLIEFAFHRDFATQLVHDGLDDIKTDTTAGDLGNGYIFRAVETLEKIRDGFGWDSDPIITDTYIDVFFALR